MNLIGIIIIIIIFTIINNLSVYTVISILILRLTMIIDFEKCEYLVLSLLVNEFL